MPKKNFQVVWVIKTILGLTESSGKSRIKMHIPNRKAFEINNLITTTIEQAESNAGCRYSELLLLSYFDAPRMLIVDVMP